MQRGFNDWNLERLPSKSVLAETAGTVDLSTLYSQEKAGAHQQGCDYYKDVIMHMVRITK